MRSQIRRPKGFFEIEQTDAQRQSAEYYLQHSATHTVKSEEIRVQESRLALRSGNSRLTGKPELKLSRRILSFLFADDSRAEPRWGAPGLPIMSSSGMPQIEVMNLPNRGCDYRKLGPASLRGCGFPSAGYAGDGVDDRTRTHRSWCS